VARVLDHALDETALRPALADAVERAAQPLEKLEQVFRPLLARIPLETEPAYVLLLPEDKS